MQATAIVTIVSNNYLHFARTLMQSVADFQSDADRYCVIVDTDLEPAQKLAEEFEAISLDQLNLPDGDDFFYQYTVLELNTAVKPWALEHLLQRGYERVIYIDPDIHLYRPLLEVLELLDGHADIVLTPHLLSPIDDDYRPTELDIRRAGTYNLGFCAMRGSDNTLRYLKWWQDKLHRDCIVDVNRGIFVDQSWMDLVPGMFERVAVLRHAGYNVAYWNLAQRSFSRNPQSQELLVNGQPLVFFHYSGLNYEQPHSVSKHQNRLTFGNIDSIVQNLFKDYAGAVRVNDTAGYSQLAYGFACYRDGQAITAAERARFRNDPELRRQCCGQPFDYPDVLRISLVDDNGVSHGLQINPASVYRLQKVFQALLGREPERAAIIYFGPRMEHPMGMLRSVLGIGLSREARLTPGWLARLLRFANEVHLVPRPAKRWLIEPMHRIVEVAGTRWPRLAWRPPSAYFHPGVSATHRDLRQQRADAAPAGSIASLPCLPGINLVGYLSAELGVGEAARALARACAVAKVPFSATDVSYQTQNLQRDISISKLSSQRRYSVDLLYVNADQVSRTTQQLQDSGNSKPQYSIGFWHWEQPVLPTYLHTAFAHVDEVWVPTTFVQDAVAKVSPVPTFKVPHALDFSVSTGVRRKDFGLPEKQMLVLMMYDFHSYQYRKNPQAAIEAFRLVARTYPQLGLVIKTINSHHHPEVFLELKDSVADLPQVVFIDDFLTRQQTWDLQSCCDILLSLHRAEGFGLAPAEMMYLGKAVVATGWSGNMDFMTSENSFPVQYQLKALDRDLGAYPAGPQWAEADIDHAAWCLEQLVNQADLVDRIGQRAAADIRQQLGPDVVGHQIKQRLQMLGHWYPHLLKTTKQG